MYMYMYVPRDMHFIYHLRQTYYVLCIRMHVLYMNIYVYMYVYTVYVNIHCVRTVCVCSVQKYQTTNGGNLSLVVSIGCGKYPAVPLGNTDILLGSTWYKTPSKVKNILQLFFTAVSEGIV